MIKSSLNNIRSKVEKRQIVHYLLLRERILGQKIQQPTKGEDIKTLKKRHSEIVKLITLIKKDGIDKVIREMHQYIHKQNDYLKLKKDSEKVGEKPNPGITIIGVKVVGICSKCRKEGDEIMKNKDNSVIPDKELSCPGCALELPIDKLLKKPVKERTNEEHIKLVKHFGGVREYLLSMGEFRE